MRFGVAGLSGVFSLDGILNINQYMDLLKTDVFMLINNENTDFSAFFQQDEVINFKLLSGYQYGFRRRKFTVHVIVRLITFIAEGLNKREQILTIFPDFPFPSKGFDFVYFKIHFKQLEN